MFGVTYTSKFSWSAPTKKNGLQDDNILAKVMFVDNKRTKLERIISEITFKHCLFVQYMECT